MALFRLLLARICAVLMVTALACFGVARAQEEGSVPGAIPDPSTYQGSMQLQQQSDAQDQQYREQQQAPQQQYSQPSQPQQYSQSPRPQQRYAPSAKGQAQQPAAHLSSDPATAAYQRGDYTSAVAILRPRAMHGNAIAAHNLGYLYEHGLGLPHDKASAVSWYRRSADQGYAAGQAALGRLYFQGVGVRRDPIEGYKWLILAGRQNLAARQMMQTAMHMITYDQMSEATRRAQLWTPVNPDAQQGTATPSATAVHRKGH